VFKQAANRRQLKKITDRVFHFQLKDHTMKTARIFSENAFKIGRQTAIVSLVIGSGLFGAVSVHAQSSTLTFTNASPNSAAAAINQRYGVTIVYKSLVNPGQTVSFSVDNPDTAAGRLLAISDLANAVGMDFQKVYVVSKIDPGATVPEVKIDLDGPIVFSSTQIPARDAIQTVASVDDALVQISDAVTGNVSLSDTHLSAAAAAAEIAKQTGTGWKAYYGLYRRDETPPRFAGMVLDRTANGQSITQSPLVTYRVTTSHTVPLNSGANAVVGPLPSPSSNPNVSSVPTVGVDGSGYGYPDLGAFGYNPYGSSYDPYGYGGPGYVVPGAPVTVPGSGTTPVAPVSPSPTGGVNSGGTTTP
jgi:hypothetical protein